MSDDVGKLAVARYNREISARESHNAEVDKAVEAVREALKLMEMVEDRRDVNGVATREYIGRANNVEGRLRRLAELAKQGPGG